MLDKVIVIGCPGSGKSFFSRALSKAAGLPLYHLDMIYHRPDRTHISREEFDEILTDILKIDRWLIDGNYQRTIDMRMKACDTVFLFDLPTDVCLEGALQRVGKERTDIPWTENSLDEDLRQFIEEFSEKQLPTIYSMLENHNDKNIVIFRSRADAEEYLRGISADPKE